MVFFNYALRKLNAKIVYYGPGLCGKTTNLQWIHDHFEGGERGELLSLATEGDRTIFFDLLPLDIGKIRGMDVTLQLYTVPGQVHYNSTRQLVLRGADGVVFVADSQRAMLQSNIDSWKNLKENLLLQGIELKDFPHVLQFNKRDLADISTVEELDEALNEYSAPFFEAVAIQGIGVQETLEGIVKLVMRSLRERYEAELGTGTARAATTAWRPPEALRAPQPPATVEPPRPAGFSAPPPEPPAEAVTRPEAAAEPAMPPLRVADDREPTLVIEPEAAGLPVEEEPEAAAETGPIEAAIPSMAMPGGEAAAAAGPGEPPEVEEPQEPPEEVSPASATGPPPEVPGSDVREESPTGPPPEGPAGSGGEPVVTEAPEPAPEAPEPPAEAGGAGTPALEEGPPAEPAGAPGEPWAAGEVAAEPEVELELPAADEPAGIGWEEAEVAAGPEEPALEGPFGEPGPEGESGAEPFAPFLPEEPGEGGAPPWLVDPETGRPAERPAEEGTGLAGGVFGGAEEAAGTTEEVSREAAPGSAEAEEVAAGSGEPVAGAGEGPDEAFTFETEEPASAVVEGEPGEWDPGVEHGAAAAAEPAPAVEPELEEPFAQAAPAESAGPFSAWDGDPFEEPAVSPTEIAPVTARAVEVSPEGNQLSVRLEGTGALAEYGQVRELDLVVPVPGGWIGNRRVTLQLRLTLVPETEES